MALPTTQNPQDLVNGALKKPPAPGQSPIGGTTSLPQNLQTPQAGQTNKALGMQQSGGMGGIGGATPGSTGATAPMAPAAPVPASLPPGSVPPAPPPPAAATPPGAPATPPGGVNAQGRNPEDQATHDASYKLLMEMISNPSRYDEEGARTTGMHHLQDEQKVARDRAAADAAGHGVFNGTPLTNEYGNISDRYLQQTGDLESKIAQDKASNFQNDRMQAMNAIFGYGTQQRLSQDQQNQLWMKMMEMGYLPPDSMNMGLPGLPGSANG